MANTPSFAGSPKVGLVNFTTADSTNDVNIVTGGTNGTRVYSVMLHNKPATAREAHVSLTDGTNVIRLATASVNATGATSQDVITSVKLQQDGAGQNYVTLPNNSWALTVALNAAVGTTNDVSVTAFGADL